MLTGSIRVLAQTRASQPVYLVDQTVGPGDYAFDFTATQTDTRFKAQELIGLGMRFKANVAANRDRH